MGGFGSGRPGSGRQKVEWCWSLDVNKLHRAGCLVPGWGGGWQWQQGGKQTASVGLVATIDALTLRYRHRVNGDEWQDVFQPVPVVRVPCRLGGHRPYFICPGAPSGRACGRRVTKLYVSGPHFLCRHCHQLTYACQHEGPGKRAQRRANKIRMRLGGDPDRGAPYPAKPRGVWWSRYLRLCHAATEAQNAADRAIIAETRALWTRLAAISLKTISSRA
jgi:hypothetical protein